MDNKTARPAESAATASGPIQKIHNNYSQLDSNSQQKTHQIKSIPSDVYRLAHIGNAKRFCKQHGHKVRCVPAWKKWIIYDGKRWKIDETNQIRILAHGTAKSIHDEAKLADDEKIMQAISRWAVQSCKTPAIDAMLEEAAPSLSVIPDQLDSDPWLLNCNNGTLDLKTGILRRHSREDLITKLVPVDYIPHAEAPTFIKAVNACFNNDQELAIYFQKAIGYSLTGDMSEQCIFINYGTGANGKSTLMEVISDVFGDYASTTRPETLMIKRVEQIPSDLAKLKGSRLVTAAEGDDGQRLAESIIKQITGGEKIQARKMYADWFEYRPEYKIWLSTNHKPRIRGTDHAIWRRIRPIPFTVKFSGKNKIPNLPAILRKELPGILAWAVQGCLMWQREGLKIPEAVRQASERYRTEMDLISKFIDDCCMLDETVSEESTVLYNNYLSWCVDEGETAVSHKKFGSCLSEKEFLRGKSTINGRIVYIGLALKN